LIFRKKKYHFNPVTLAFEEIIIPRGRRVRKILLLLLSGLTFIMLAGFVLNQVFDSRESILLEKQVAVLNHEMQKMVVKGRSFSQALRQDLFKKDNTYRTILEIDTLPYSVRLAGTGGSAHEYELVSQYNLSHQVDYMIDKLNRQLKIQSNSFETLYKTALEHSYQQTHLPAIQPVSDHDLIMISSDFGWRSDPFHFLQSVHSGLDFVTAAGKNVYATGDGIVTFMQLSRTGYGNEILIDHKFGFTSRYAHLQSISVKEGDTVKRGQVIGKVGETGRATGPHLHYEVLYQHRPVNPSFYFDNSLTNEEYAQILKLASKETN
jgi:hypothetical protein